MTDARLAPLIPVIKASGAEAVCIVPGANFFRIFGTDFHSHERPLAVLLRADGVAAAVAPEIEASRFAELELDAETFTWRDQDGFADAFIAAAGALGPLGSIAVEGQRMRVFEAQALENAFKGARLIDAQRAIAGIRLRKTPEEIQTLRAAIQLSEAALEATLGEIRVGMTEGEIQSLLIRHLFDAGAQGLSFDPIVAAGANAYNLHAESRPDYRVKPGDALLIDYGGRKGGYTADITRTFFIAEVADEDRALYEAVLAANAAGRLATRPGLTAGELDDIVTSSLEASPYAALIRHKTGHGLGLDVHEDPYIMRGNDAALEPGVVFTIEPGLYREGRLGVRIEDDVVVTESGGESLTTFPREVRVVG